VVVLVEGPNLARIPQTTAHHVSREYPILEE
jgi:hypothetical protein